MGETHGDDFLGFQGLQGGGQKSISTRNETFLRSYKSGNIFPLRPSAWLPVRWPWAVPYWGISMPCLLNNSQMTADCGCHELREAIRTALLRLSAPCSVVQITNNASSGLSCLKRENLHLDFGVFKPAWVLGPLVPENGLKLCLQPEGRHCLRVGTLCLSLCGWKLAKGARICCLKLPPFSSFYISSYWTQILCSNTPQSPLVPLVSGNKDSTLFS